MPQYGGSAGCFGPMSDFNVANYTSGNVGTSRYTGTGQKAIDAFGKDIYQSIKYYYDKDQFKNRRWY